MILHPLLLNPLYSYFVDISTPGTLNCDDLLHDAPPAALLLRSLSLTFGFSGGYIIIVINN